MKNQENQVQAITLIGRTMNIQAKGSRQIIRDVRLIDVKAPNVVFQYESGRKQGETFEMESHSFKWEPINNETEAKIWELERSLEIFTREEPNDALKAFIKEHVENPLAELRAKLEEEKAAL